MKYFCLQARQFSQQDPHQGLLHPSQDLLRGPAERPVRGGTAAPGLRGRGRGGGGGPGGGRRGDGRECAGPGVSPDWRDEKEPAQVQDSNLSPGQQVSRIFLFFRSEIFSLCDSVTHSDTLTRLLSSLLNFQFDSTREILTVTWARGEIRPEHL